MASKEARGSPSTVLTGAPLLIRQRMGTRGQEPQPALRATGTLSKGMHNLVSRKSLTDGTVQNPVSFLNSGIAQQHWGRCCCEAGTQHNSLPPGCSLSGSSAFESLAALCPRFSEWHGEHFSLGSLQRCWDERWGCCSGDLLPEQLLWSPRSYEKQATPAPLQSSFHSHNHSPNTGS